MMSGPNGCTCGFNGDCNCPFDASDTDEQFLELDPTCPVCKEHSCVDEVFDGSTRRCGSCGALLVAVEWTDGTMSMLRAEDGTSNSPAAKLTGRQRTRALWRKRGRR